MQMSAEPDDPFENEFQPQTIIEANHRNNDTMSMFEIVVDWDGTEYQGILKGIGIPQFQSRGRYTKIVQARLFRQLADWYEEQADLERRSIEQGVDCRCDGKSTKPPLPVDSDDLMGRALYLADHYKARLTSTPDGTLNFDCPTRNVWGLTQALKRFGLKNSVVRPTKV